MSTPKVIIRRIRYIETDGMPITRSNLENCARKINENTTLGKESNPKNILEYFV